MVPQALKNRTILIFDSFFFLQGVPLWDFEGVKIEGQHEGRPMLSINTSNWTVCQDEIDHKFDVDHFVFSRFFYEGNRSLILRIVSKEAKTTEKFHSKKNGHETPDMTKLS